MEVKFYSNYLEKEIKGTVVEERKYTVKIKLEDGNVIIKKKKQLM